MAHRDRSHGGIRLAAPLLVLAVMCAGCGDDEEARARCDQERDAREDSFCFPEASYNECIAAFDECADDVVVDVMSDATSCKTTFTCPP
jgi:hypothetical protein